MPLVSMISNWLNGWTEPVGSGSITLSARSRISLATHDRLSLDA